MNNVHPLFVAAMSGTGAGVAFWLGSPAAGAAGLVLGLAMLIWQAVALGRE